MRGPAPPSLPPSGDPDPAGPDPGAAREAGCIAGIGLLLLPALVWGFSARLGLAFTDALLLAAILGLLPVLAVAQVPLVGRAEVERMGAYLGSGAMLVFLGSATLALGADDPGLVAMGLGPADPWLVLRWTALLLVASAALQLLFLKAGEVLGWEESPVLRQLLPRTGNEKRAFVALSVTAALGEEIAFRGYAIPLLAPFLGGPWGAAAFTSGIFGLLHAYQGTIGIVRTAVFGGVLAASFVASGTLWPAILAHFAVNAVVGVWLGDRWLDRTAGEDGPHTGDGPG